MLRVADRQCVLCRSPTQTSPWMICGPWTLPNWMAGAVWPPTVQVIPLLLRVSLRLPALLHSQLLSISVVQERTFLSLNQGGRQMRMQAQMRVS